MSNGPGLYAGLTQHYVALVYLGELRADQTHLDLIC